MFKAVDKFLNNFEEETVESVESVEPEEPEEPEEPAEQVEPAEPVEKVDLAEIKVDKEQFSLSEMIFNFFVNSLMCSSKRADAIIEPNKPVEIDSAVI
jgi:hypothetical protein